MSISVCAQRASVSYTHAEADRTAPCHLCILGANPSAEEQDEALEEGATQVNNVVYSFRLQSTSFDKKSFLTYLKVRLHTQFCPYSDLLHLIIILSRSFSFRPSIPSVYRVT